MAQKRIPIEIDLKTREAQRAVKDLNRELGRTEDDLDDAGSAGKKMARALEMSADAMIGELEETRRAVDALERALGPDFDADVIDVVADLKRVGLTAQDVEQDAEELAAALKRSGDVKIRAKELGFNDVDKALGHTTDNSRVASTAIGGIGGSISELPGVGGLGPIAESIGQLSENALEGEANLKGLVLAGGGLAAVAGAMYVINRHMEEQAAIKAFNTEQVDEWVDAIYEAETAVEGLVDSYRNAGQIEVETPFDGIQDITSDLARANVTVDEWTEAVQGNAEAQADLEEKVAQAGLSGEQVVKVIVGLKNAQDNYAEATRKAGDRTKVFADETKLTERQVDTLKSRVDNYIQSLDGIPTVKSSRIEAYMDEGKYFEARRLLDELTRPRSVILSPRTNAMAPVRAMDSGGTIGSGDMALVAERRPEFVNGQLVTQPSLVGGPARVTGGAATAGKLGGVTNNYIINVGPGATPDSGRWIVEELKKYERRNGPGSVML